MKNILDKVIVNIKRNELIKLFMLVDKSTFVYLITKVIQGDMNKTGNPFYGKIEKIQKGNYLIGNTHEDRIGGNETKEGLENTFESSPNKIGKHISKCVLYNEKLDRYYLQYEYFKGNTTKIEYRFEGDTIEKTLFESYLKQKSEPTNQPQQKKVYFQSFKFDSIMECTLNGVHYVIED